jgi:hypothetical protein
VKRFRAIAEALFRRPFTAVDGIPEVDLDGVPGCGYELPKGLQDFYAVVGKYRQVITARDRFCTPSAFPDGRQAGVLRREASRRVLGIR